MVFVNSMSDLFHADVPDEYVAAVAEVMKHSPWHLYQVLTKRSGRMRGILSSALCGAAQAAHIWWGVSVENRRHGAPRIDDLRNTPATVRFLSIEPLLEDLGEINLDGIHWVIAGGESGPGARPMSRDWVISVMEQCRRHDVPFFFKQWGGVHKKRAGRELDGRTFDEFPKMVRSEFPPKVQRMQILRSVASKISSLLGQAEEGNQMKIFRTDRL
jgi:protein gp37